MNNKVDNTDTVVTPYVTEYQNIRKKFVNGDFKGAASIFDKLYSALVRLHGQENAKKTLGEIINKVGVDHIDFVMQDVLSRNFTAIISDDKRYLNNFRTILEGADKAPLRMQNTNLDQFLVNGAKLNTEVLAGLLRHYDNLYEKNSTAAQVNLLMNLQDHILKNSPSDSKSIKLIQNELYKLFLHKKQALVDDMIENPSHALFIMKNPRIMELLFNEANHEQLNQLIDKCKPELGRAIVEFNLLGDQPNINLNIRERLPSQENANQRKLIISLFTATEGYLNESTLDAYLRLYDNPADRLEILKTIFDEIKSNTNNKYPATGLDIRRLFGYSSRQIEDIRLIQKACLEVLKTNKDNPEVQRFISGENASVNSARDLTELLDFETRLFTFDRMTKERVQAIETTGNPQVMIMQLFAATPSGQSPFNAYSVIDIIGKFLNNPVKKIANVPIDQIATYMIAHPEHAGYFLEPRSRFLGGKDFLEELRENDRLIEELISKGTPELRQIILESGIHMFAKNKEQLESQLTALIKADKVSEDNINFALHALSKVDDIETICSILMKVAEDSGLGKSSVLEGKKLKKSEALVVAKEMLNNNPHLVTPLEEALKEAMIKKIDELVKKFKEYEVEGSELMSAIDQALSNNQFNFEAGQNPQTLYAALNGLHAYIKQTSTLPQNDQYSTMKFEDVLKLYSEINDINRGMKNSYDVVKESSKGIGKASPVKMRSVNRGTPAEGRKYARDKNTESLSQHRVEAPELYSTIDEPKENNQLTPEMIKKIREKNRGAFVGANIQQKKIDKDDLKDFPLSNNDIEMILQRAEKIHRRISELTEAKNNPRYFMDDNIRNELKAILAHNINSEGKFSDLSKVMNHVKEMFDRYDRRVENQEFKQREGEVIARPSVLSSLASKLPGHEKGLVKAMKEKQLANSISILKRRIAEADRFVASEVKTGNLDELIRRADFFLKQIDKDNARFKQDSDSAEDYESVAEIKSKLQKFITDLEKLKLEVMKQSSTADISTIYISTADAEKLKVGVAASLTELNQYMDAVDALLIRQTAGLSPSDIETARKELEQAKNRVGRLNIPDEVLARYDNTQEKLLAAQKEKAESIPHWTTTRVDQEFEMEFDTENLLDRISITMDKFDRYLDEADKKLDTDLSNLDTNELKVVIALTAADQQKLEKERIKIEIQMKQVGKENIPEELNAQYITLTQRIEATQAKLTKLSNMAEIKLALSGYEAALRNINGLIRSKIPKDKYSLVLLSNNLDAVEKYPPYQHYIKLKSQNEGFDKNDPAEVTNNTKAVPEEYKLTPVQIKAYNDIAELKERYSKYKNCKIPLVKSYYESRVREQLIKMNIPNTPFQKLINEIGEFKVQSTAAPPASKK